MAKEIENLLALFPAFSESVMAAEENLLIHLGYRPRNFITRRSVLVTVWPGEKVDEKLSRKINAIFIVGPERTLEQDVEFAISQLVEIAVRALSPGINDPITAITCIDWLGVSLCQLANRKITSSHRYDRQNRLKEKGLKVAVVEKSERPGGTCALAGCQPKKWFYEATETIARSRHLAGKGIVAAAEGNWAQVLEQKRRFTAGIPEDTIKNLREAGIDFVSGAAAFLDDKTLSVNGKRVQANFFIVATGAKPMRLPLEGIEHVITSDDFLELNMLPPSILFIGGGFISFEFAHFAARLGSTNQRSVILEVSDRPLGAFDTEMVELLAEASRHEGIDVRTGTDIEVIEKHAKGFSVRTANGDSFEADLVVHGAGRAPDLDTLGLDAAGVEYSKGGITVDQTLRTSNRHIYAVGDCASTIQLARIADKEAHVAAENILAELGLGRKAAMDYRIVPAVLFTYPQCGMVGQTEADLKQAGTTYRRSFAKNLSWPTYRRVGLKNAAYKILADPNNQILGAHILSDHAAGMINTIKQAMLNETAVDELYRQTIVSPYPSRESDLSYMLKPLLSD